MTEIDLLKRVRDDVPEPDPLVLARARQRLLTAPPVRRRVVRPRLVVAGGLALILAGGFLAADVMSRDGNSAVPGATADAGTFLADAAAKAKADPEVSIPPGKFRQVTTERTFLYKFGPKKEFTATEHLRQDSWVTADPSRPYTLRIQELAKVDFATPQDKAAARRYAPFLLGHPKPRLGRATCRGVLIEPDTQTAPCTPSWEFPSPAFLAGQPRDPDELLAALRKYTPPVLPRDGVPERQLELARAAAMSPDQRAFGRIASALNSGFAPADLRAALYEAARKIPGMRLTDDVETLDGRHGRAIGLAVNEGQRLDLIISPSNGQSIGSRLVDVGNGTATNDVVYSAESFTTRITPTQPLTK